MLNNLFLQKSKMALFDMTIMEVSEYIMPYPVGHTKFFSENHNCVEFFVDCTSELQIHRVNGHV